MISDIKGIRKLLFVLIALLVATIGLFVGKIDPATFADLLKWMGGLFVAGNVAENVANAVTGV